MSRVPVSLRVVEGVCAQMTLTHIGERKVPERSSDCARWRMNWLVEDTDRSLDGVYGHRQFLLLNSIIKLTERVEELAASRARMPEVCLGAMLASSSLAEGMGKIWAPSKEA